MSSFCRAPCCCVFQGPKGEGFFSPPIRIPHILLQLQHFPVGPQASRIGSTAVGSKRCLRTGLFWGRQRDPFCGLHTMSFNGWNIHHEFGHKLHAVAYLNSYSDHYPSFNSPRPRIKPTSRYRDFAVCNLLGHLSLERIPCDIIKLHCKIQLASRLWHPVRRHWCRGTKLFRGEYFGSWRSACFTGHPGQSHASTATLKGGGLACLRCFSCWAAERFSVCVCAHAARREKPFGFFKLIGMVIQRRHHFNGAHEMLRIWPARIGGVHP